MLNGRTETIDARWYVTRWLALRTNPKRSTDAPRSKPLFEALARTPSSADRPISGSRAVFPSTAPESP
jgi:hypothetical protein